MTLHDILNHIIISVFTFCFDVTLLMIVLRLPFAAMSKDMMPLDILFITSPVGE